MDEKSYDLTEAIDFVLGDESEVEESDSDFEEDIDSMPANAFGNESDSGEEENLPLQELVKEKKRKKTTLAQIMKKMVTNTQPKLQFLQLFKGHRIL